ncbi:hypothetical protein [Motilibacter rhizosphaerae]|nr:hypothetical protein [Motilibacter rhizosphaerae]
MASNSSARHFALLGGYSKSGAFELAEDTLVVTAVGGVSLDLTSATLPPVSTITKISLVGGMSVRVPAGVRVEVEGFALPLITKQSAPSGDGPLVRLRCYGALGGVSVRQG